MSKHRFIFVVLVLTAMMVTIVQAQINTGIGNNGIPDSFHTALKDYFKVSEQQIYSCQQSGIQDEELPVVFFIAQRANVDPDAVVVVHSSGLNWMQVAAHFHLNPWIFFIPIQGDLKNTPYARGYSYYQSRKQRVDLTDNEIINFVNLKFISEHYDRAPQEIVQMRTAGKSFWDINDSYARNKDGAQWDVKTFNTGDPDDAPTVTPSRHGHRHSQQ